MNRLFSKPVIISTVVLLIITGIGMYAWQENRRPAILEIWIFSLKSGRSMFIRTANDYRILIDGGAGPEVIRSLSKILPFFTRRIDAVMATNTEGKNVGGLIEALERYEVRNVYVPAIDLVSLNLASSTDQIYQSFRDTIKAKQLNEMPISAGTELNLDSVTRLSILFPVKPEAFAYSKASGPEVLFNLTFKSFKLTFLSAVSPKIQKYIASTSKEINSTSVLVVSNNPSPSNVAPVLIDKLKPKYLVMSKSESVNRAVANSTVAKSIVTKQTATTSSNKRKVKAPKVPIDPLQYLSDKFRFNTKNQSVKITSDGSEVIKIEYW